MPLVGAQAASPLSTLGCTIAKKLAWLSGVREVVPIFILTFAPIPSIVATPEANWLSVAFIVDPLAPLADPGVIVPPPLAVRLLIFILVLPNEFGFEPIVLSITTDAGIKTDLLIAVNPSEAERFALAPKEVALPTLKEVRLPLVKERFSVDLVEATDGAVTVEPFPVIEDWVGVVVVVVGEVVV